MKDWFKGTTISHMKDGQLNRRDALKALFTLGLAGAAACSPLSTALAPTSEPTQDLDPTAEATNIPKSTAEVVNGHEGEIITNFLKSHPEFEDKANRLTTLRININGINYDTAVYELTDEELKTANVRLDIVDTNDDLSPDTEVLTVQNILAFNTDVNGKWEKLEGIAIPKTDGSISNVYGLPAKTFTSSMGYKIFEVRTYSDGQVMALWPNVSNIPGWDGVNAFIINNAPPNVLKVLALQRAPEPPATPEVKMTFEDWQNSLNVSWKSLEGKTYNIWDEIVKKTLKHTDAEKILALPPSTPIVILNTNGVATCISDIEPAAEAARNGATILTPINEDTSTPGFICKWILRAANTQYEIGGSNIKVNFGENHGSDFPISFSIGINDILTINEDGRIVSPVLDRPLHYELTEGIKQNAKPQNVDPTYWMEEVLTNGYNAIAISPR
jgi:hypothetical protein